MATTAYVINYPPNIAMCNFGKSNSNIELTIELIRTMDGLPAQYSGTIFPHMV
jgi:hypothetical protein